MLSVLALSLDPKQIFDSLSPYGEIGLMLIIFAETGLLIGFFLPGDSLLFTAGLLANQGKLNLAAVLIGCFVAAVIGDQVGFTIGQKAGPPLFRRPDSRFFKREYVDRTEQFFEAHGPKTIVIARFVPIVRTFAPVLAGVGSMSRRTFFTYNVIGAFVWVFGVTMAGYLLSDVIGEDIDTYLLPIIAVIIIVSLIPPFLEWRKAKKHPSAPGERRRSRSRSRRAPRDPRRRVARRPGATQKVAKWNARVTNRYRERRQPISTMRVAGCQSGRRATTSPAGDTSAARPGNSSSRAPRLRRERDRRRRSDGRGAPRRRARSLPPLEAGAETGLVGAAAGEPGRGAEEHDPGAGGGRLRERVVDRSLGADGDTERHRAEVEQRGLVTGRESVFSFTQVTFAVRTDDAPALRVDLRDEELTVASLGDAEQRGHPAVGRARQRRRPLVVDRDRILGMGSRIDRPVSDISGNTAMSHPARAASSRTRPCISRLAVSALLSHCTAASSARDQDARAATSSASYSPALAPAGAPCASSDSSTISASSPNAPPLRFENATAMISTTRHTPAIEKRAASSLRVLMIAGSTSSDTRFITLMSGLSAARRCP